MYAEYLNDMHISGMFGANELNSQETSKEA